MVGTPSSTRSRDPLTLPTLRFLLALPPPDGLK
jgi:hypothetical protein